MLRILESQAPAKQNATDTINTLSNRLTSATLLEDRRAAILGLRSFAKIYPASVASGALRDLIAGLRRDGEDPDTLKVVLETLLMLFEPDEKSPEASEDIPLWLADEFTQRQDNITALLDFLETGEFYLRLYALQILSHVCAARPQRTQEAVLTAPLGVSRISSVLDDKREAVRNEALLLLVALTPTSAELQKVVAFENAFDRVFALVENEGGLTHGSTTVQDCLSLLANLLTLNTSNQSYFREMGYISRVSKLLAAIIKEEESPDGVSEWMRPQRDMNLWGLLAIIQLFLARGSQGIFQSQNTFWQTGVLQRILQIAFHPTFGSNVRAKSLETCGDIIRGNPGLQEQFGDLAVPSLKQRAATTNGHSTPISGRKSGPATPLPVEMTNVIESLLELTLENSPFSAFDVRLAACSCVKAFFEGHAGIRGHVLKRAIEGHRSGDDAVPNILTVLLEPPSTRSNSDPYQQWMASVLLLHLIYENAETKSMALNVFEGDAENGEEVVTFVQGITSNVVAGVQHPEDERALLGYLMLLSTWLFEDPDAVNDLLGEGSNVQGLASAVKVATPTMPLVAGLCTLVLGVIYEFSTKDSPIPRSTLHGVLSKSLGRELYIDRLTKLRESPYIRDFEVLPMNTDSGIPDVFFDRTFVDFFKDNFSRLLRAIDREPGFEVSILTNGIQKGISRELVDSLRLQNEEQKVALEAAETDLLSLRQKLEQEEREHGRTREKTTLELGRIKQINQSLQNNHEEELQHLQLELNRQTETLSKSHEAAIAQIRRDHLTAVEQAARQQKAEKEYLEQRRNGTERDLAKTKEALTKRQSDLETAMSSIVMIKEQTGAEIQDLQAFVRSLQAELSKKQSDHERQLDLITQEHNTKLSATSARAEESDHKLSQAQKAVDDHQEQMKLARDVAASHQSRLIDVENTARETHEKLKASEAQIEELEKEIAELRSAATKQKEIQTELDDLLVVFADLEVKRAADKAKLKELGEEVSEDEDGDDEEDDGSQADEEGSEVD